MKTFIRRPESKDWKAQQSKSLGANKPKDLNRINRIRGSMLTGGEPQFQQQLNYTIKKMQFSISVKNISHKSCQCRNNDFWSSNDK